MMVGVPPLLFMQKAMGSTRPNDAGASSEWAFWKDDNGASGHTFVGAIPFLTAAHMTDRPAMKRLLIVASTLPGWSRLNDNNHYPSQIVMGWWLAYAATSAVQQTDQQERFQIVPLAFPEGQGIGVQWDY